MIITQCQRGQTEKFMKYLEKKIPKKDSEQKIQFELPSDYHMTLIIFHLPQNFQTYNVALMRTRKMEKHAFSTYTYK